MRVGNLVGEIFVDARPGQIFQMLLRGLARRHRLVGILVFELVERKRDAAGKAHGFRDRLRQIAKQPRHFMRRLQMALGIGFKPPADGVDGGLLADAGQDILQRAARGMVVQHLVGRQQRHPGRAAQADAAAPAGAGRRRDRAGLRQARRHRRGCASAAPELFSALRRLETMRQHQHQKLPFGEFQEVIELQMTFALFDPVMSSPRLPRVSNWHSRP